MELWLLITCRIHLHECQRLDHLYSRDHYSRVMLWNCRKLWWCTSECWDRDKVTHANDFVILWVLILKYTLLLKSSTVTLKNMKVSLYIMQIYSLQRNSEAAYKCMVSFGWGRIRGKSGNIKQASLVWLQLIKQGLASWMKGCVILSSLLELPK